MNIGIVGNGVVGGALAHAFAAKDHIVLTYDKEASRRTHALAQVLAADVVFVCLPTPQKEGSLDCDLSYVEQFFDGVGRVFSEQLSSNFVLKSTVPVGTTRKLAAEFGLTNLVHSPEFLTARTAKEDAAQPRVNIVGFCVKLDVVDKVNWPVCQLYRQTWPDTGIQHMTSDESEFVKLMQNSFSAVKISFFNEMRCFADKVGLDWQVCLSAALTQGWIGEMHTQVPGPDGQRGFGGNCLPKDLANLIQCMRDAGTDIAPVILDAADRRNRLIDRPRN